jgi:hypothetical protein
MGVWDTLKGTPGSQIPMKVLSAALDHMVKLSKQPGYMLTDAELGAVGELLSAATAQLAGMNAWCLAAFIRCAAGFKGLLPRDGLAAWQAALRQPGRVQELTQQGVSNVLLSLGTLADSDPQLAAAVDRPLVEQLLQHAVNVLGGKDGRNACNALYGAALLELQPSRSQMEAVFGVVGWAANSLHYISITQLLLASRRLAKQGEKLQVQHGSRPPSQNPYHIYYPGDDLMGKLLDRALQLLHEGVPSGVASQVLGACGTLGYLPAPAAMGELLAGAAPASCIQGPTPKLLLHLFLPGILMSPQGGMLACGLPGPTRFAPYESCMA